MASLSGSPWALSPGRQIPHGGRLPKKEIDRYRVRPLTARMPRAPGRRSPVAGLPATGKLLAWCTRRRSPGRQPTQTALLRLIFSCKNCKKAFHACQHQLFFVRPLDVAAKSKYAYNRWPAIPAGKENKMTGNQVVAKFVLGYVPRGYVCCCESCGGKSAGNGQIFVDGRWIASVPKSLHGGKLPQPSEVSQLVAR